MEHIINYVLKRNVWAEKFHYQNMKMDGKLFYLQETGRDFDKPL